MSHDNRERLEVGDRVRHIGQEYTRALAYGTATITAVLKQHPSDETWEYEVRTDAGEVRRWNYVDTPDAWLAEFFPQLDPSIALAQNGAER